MEKTEFHNLEIDNSKGLAIVQAPLQLIGGRDSLALTQMLGNLPAEVKSFVIALDKVTAINSTGLGTLISAHRTLTGKSIKLYLLNPTPKIIELMGITHLDKIFTFITSISEI
jgi:anti-anti-sigma factor